MISTAKDQQEDSMREFTRLSMHGNIDLEGGWLECSGDKITFSTPGWKMEDATITIMDGENNSISIEQFQPEIFKEAIILTAPKEPSSDLYHFTFVFDVSYVEWSVQYK